MKRSQNDDFLFTLFASNNSKIYRINPAIHALKIVKESKKIKEKVGK